MNRLRLGLMAVSVAALGAISAAQTAPAEDPREDASDALPGEGTSDSQSETVSDEAGADTDSIETPRARPRTWNKRQAATLRGLDKITGRSTDFRMRVGQPFEFGSLRVHLQVCYQTPPEEVPESAAFLQVDSLKPMADIIDENAEAEPRIFSGWMFASSPGLNALEHPVYDVWVIECAATPAPDVPAEE